MLHRTIFTIEHFEFFNKQTAHNLYLYVIGIRQIRSLAGHVLLDDQTRSTPNMRLYVLLYYYHKHRKPAVELLILL